MKITDVKVHRLKKLETPFKWWEEGPPRYFQMHVLRIMTDEGVEGDFMTFLVEPAEFEGALGGESSVLLPALKNTLLGRDPHDVEAIWQALSAHGQRPSGIQSAVDCCLWDILGKYHKEPVYRLLGAARDRIRAYASTMYYPTDEEYVKLALQCKNEGFTAIKLHAYAISKKDIKVCQLVRKAVGDEVDLMLDPVNRYDRRGAFEVGRALEKLNFYWYEAPLPDTDIDGLADLSRSLDIQVQGTEAALEGLLQYPKFILAGAVDGIRTVGDLAGGITAERKTAALCEAFGLKYEPHHYGPTLVVAAQMHVSLACANCDFVELPVPQGVLDIGMKDVIRVGKDGYVAAPTKPGLGYDLDWNEIDRLTEKVL